MELLTHMFPVFDEYRKQFLVGEMVWTFADFETAQGKSSYIEFVLLSVASKVHVFFTVP